MLWGERRDLCTNFVRLILSSNTPTGRYTDSLMHKAVDDVKLSIETLKSSIIKSASSRRTTYLEMNPSLTVHRIYNCCGEANEVHRIVFTRLRVISHSLAIKTWSRSLGGGRAVVSMQCPANRTTGDRTQSVD